MDNKPVSNGLNPKPCCTNVFVTSSVPATVLIKKLANVALLYNLFLKSEKSISGCITLCSTIKNIINDSTKTIPSDTISSENKPNCAVCVIIIFKLSNMTTNKTRPKLSNRSLVGLIFLDSGVPLISIIDIKETIIEKINIHCQPIKVAITPPKIEAKPEPFHEPIDQKLRARCRSLS